MNLDAASLGSSGGSSGTPPQARKERGAIAAQACDMCRIRKQKCDEERPCSTCRRLQLPCNYREPLPTKKDKTMVEMFEVVKLMDYKLDRLANQLQSQHGTSSQSRYSPASQSGIGGSGALLPAPEDRSHRSGSSMLSLQASSPHNSAKNIYRHSTAAHKILSWPAIQELLLQASPSNEDDLKTLEREGSAFIIRMQQGKEGLLLEDGIIQKPFLGMQSRESRASGAARVRFPSLTAETMHALGKAYFDTFNLLYPFMDRRDFFSDTLTKVLSEGFDADKESIIALLVFALGELATQGIDGNPVDAYDGRPSGLRGGSHTRPPGLAYFNEARKRIGFVMTECDLENVQIFSLAALYNQCCCRHVDFWRSTVSASSACQVLITCSTIDWNSSRGDLIKRAYWHCVIMETGLYLELDLPLTGLMTLEGSVGVPTFNNPISEADYGANQDTHWEKHFCSQLALRRLCANIHDRINNLNNASSLTPIASNDNFGVPAAPFLHELADSLKEWRALLPGELQWPDDDTTSFPLLPGSGQLPMQQASSSSQHLPAIDPSLTFPLTSQHLPLFSEDLDAPPIHYDYVYDMQVALLRTRYSYAKYMVYRPFVYKALHFPGDMTQHDAESAAECLRSCVLWPVLLSPPSRHKRLVPYLFCWSQNFLGILLIVHLAKHNPILKEISESLCGENFERDIATTVQLMLDWIRDLSCGNDPVAEWCWKMLRGVYY